jgi:F-type H+-transporting ATPase subunit gamma
MGGAEQKSGERLENIRSVEPILNALRTIAMGNAKAALKRREWALAFAQQTGAILAYLPPGVWPSPAGAAADGDPERQARVTTLVIGSERGLCGAFNRVLAEQAGRHLEQAARRGETVQLKAAGTAAARVLGRMGLRAERLLTTSTTALPTSGTADGLVRDWLAAYEAEELDRVDVLYNAYLGPGRFDARVLRLIPPQIPRPAPDVFLETAYPPIIQTDPLGLIARVVVQQVSARLYACLLESAAAENSARYQILEDARLNIDRLTDDLEAEAAQARRQAITLEIQNLAVGSGLLEEG